MSRHGDTYSYLHDHSAEQLCDRLEVRGGRGIGTVEGLRVNTPPLFTSRTVPLPLSQLTSMKIDGSLLSRTQQNTLSQP
jgi:hypothetical protein